MRLARLVMFTVFGFSLSLGATLVLGQPAQADPIPPVTSPLWEEFHFAGPGSSATACDFSSCGSPGANSVYAPNPPWTFTTLVPETLNVTDAFLAGDAFDVFDFGAPILSTPSVPTGGSCGADPDFCFYSEDPTARHNSQGSVGLAVGDHSLTITARDSPFGSGNAYFQTSAAVVPEPGSLMLLGSGLLPALVALRRRNRGKGSS